MVDKSLKRLMVAQLVWMIIFVVPVALAACAIQKQKKDPRPVWAQYPTTPTKVIEKKVYVNCMDPVPTFDYEMTFPESDRAGNVIIHESTLKEVRNRLYVLERYVAKEYSKCHYTALSVGGAP